MIITVPKENLMADVRRWARDHLRAIGVPEEMHDAVFDRAYSERDASGETIFTFLPKLLAEGRRAMGAKRG